MRQPPPTAPRRHHLGPGRWSAACRPLCAPPPASARSRSSAACAPPPAPAPAARCRRRAPGPRRRRCRRRRPAALLGRSPLQTGAWRCRSEGAQGGGGAAVSVQHASKKAEAAKLVGVGGCGGGRRGRRPGAAAAGALASAARQQRRPAALRKAAAGPEQGNWRQGSRSSECSTLTRLESLGSASHHLRHASSVVEVLGPDVGPQTLPPRRPAAPRRRRGERSLRLQAARHGRCSAPPSCPCTAPAPSSRIWRGSTSWH